MAYNIIIWGVDLMTVGMTNASKDFYKLSDSTT